MGEKYFIITIDVEGDNLWEATTTIATENGKYLERFQILCEKYNFIPTYLTDYEMTKSKAFVELGVNGLKNQLLEIGMHLHAWNTPPIIWGKDGMTMKKPYLIEYERNHMEAKIHYMTQRLEHVFQCNITSHRAGRWAFNETYATILWQQGYLADCSVTPGISWYKHRGQEAHSHGSNYKKFKKHAYELSLENIKQEGISGLWEVPVTIGKGKNWLRPTRTNRKDLLRLVDEKNKEEVKYLEFMLHSSELMPSGSPNFSTQGDIENLYESLEELFQKIRETYTGIGLSEYVKKLQSQK